ncbi:type II toxin-antitoxin system RelE/ParE family toxin [Polaribacter porphyrae]|uniref:Toxin n=1 Tax=Polaribacter porphyrae TaxID=1137780 RepID=A0A2S7WRE2_9FLAO|nr:type II toxin-antitoxin system RelE/ParE family toxin [Polaribacter porphyrae]PQJ79881.1 plasmid stabilization protein [Polaribacter porphyrae]
MARYKLTNKAVEDLSKIWEYTFDVWSEKQATKYYEMLISSCQKIADKPNLGKNYVGVTKQLFGLKVQKHIIFYRITNQNYIEITRVLHERMNLKNRLNK